MLMRHSLLGQRGWAATTILLIACGVLMIGSSRLWANAELIVCDGSEVICDPVPGASDDGEVFNNASIYYLAGSVGNAGGERALVKGAVMYHIPNMTSGILTYEVMGLKEGAGFCGLSNGMNPRSRDFAGLGMSVQKGKLRVEMAKYGACESDPIRGNKKIPFSSKAMLQVRVEWDPRMIYFYAGNTLLMTKPNAMGDYVPPNWKHNPCNGKRHTSGPLFPASMEIDYNDYFGMRPNALSIRNVRLVYK